VTKAGKGLGYLIERALEKGIPVVIAVSSQRFVDWIEFADGRSVKLTCDREALKAWWRDVSGRAPAATRARNDREVRK
jgi:hypothetical protein